jgi:predicted MFS family arabinose efflux permease
VVACIDIRFVRWRRVRSTLLAGDSPRVVRQDDIAAASALNGIDFNFARAVGPALAGLVIAVSGVAVAFVVNVISFAGGAT